MRREVSNSGATKNVWQGQVNAKNVAHASDDAHGGQRMSANFQKRVVNAHVIQSEDGGPDAGQCFFAGRARRREVITAGRAHVGARQRPPI